MQEDGSKLLGRQQTHCSWGDLRSWLNRCCLGIAYMELRDLITSRSLSY